MNPPAVPYDAPRAVLDAYARALRREAHVLTERPELAFQQVHNRLQWEGELVDARLAVERERRSVPGARPWLRTLTRFWESEALIRTLTGHSSDVRACGFSPDGSRIVSASDDKTVKVWDAVAGGELATLTGHTKRVQTCGFSPDGTRIVSASDDKTVKVWDAAGGAELATLTGHTAGVRTCGFSPDGTRIVSASDDKTLKVWDIDTGEELLTLGRYSGHTDYASACAFSPDGSRIVSASEDTTLKVWDTETRKELGTLAGHAGYVMACAFSPDGSRIVSASADGTLRLWNARVEQLEMRLPRRHAGMVLDCAFSPDGARIISGSAVPEDPLQPRPGMPLYGSGNLKVWDGETGREVADLNHSVGNRGYVWDCGFDPEGARIVSASSDSGVTVWDAKTGERLATLGGHEVNYGVFSVVRACAFSPDGSRIASVGTDGNLELWAEGRSRTLSGGHGQMLDCCFDPDGVRIVSASADGALELWDADTGKLLSTLLDHEQHVTRCAFSPDGSRIVSGGSDGTVKVWDAEIGIEIVTLESRGFHCSFVPDGRRIVAAAGEDTLKLWDATTGVETARLWLPFPYALGAVAAHPWLPRVAIGDWAGAVHVVDLVGVEYGPIVVTPAAHDDGFAVRCPACWQTHGVEPDQLCSVLRCPTAGCDLELRANPFAVGVGSRRAVHGRHRDVHGPKPSTGRSGPREESETTPRKKPRWWLRGSR